jgi:hypothetical protein
MIRTDAAPPVPSQPVLPALGPDDHVPVPGTLSFGAFLSALNPLHHLPVVGTIYRAATGETIAPPLRVLGGALFGGPVGLFSAAIFAAIEEFRAAEPAGRPGADPATRFAAATRMDGHG